jgi:uncharacterized protein DUF6431
VSAFNLKLLNQSNERQTKMIIPCFAFESLEEYNEKSDSVDLVKPDQCGACGAEECFWGHGCYQRTVVHEGTETLVKVRRYLCRWCGKTVSLLFSFLVAYRKHSASTVAEGIERYSTAETTYRGVATALSSLDAEDQPPNPSHSTAFRWIKDIAARAESLCFHIQKELILRGKLQASNIDSGYCPNSWKARTEEKELNLNRLAEGIQLGLLLVENSEKIMELLHTVFLKNVETIQMILCNHLIKLSAPQNLRHMI